jgi:hypothetical protein
MNKFLKQTVFVLYLATLVLITPTLGMAQTGGGGNSVGTGSGGNSVIKFDNPLNVSSLCGLLQKLLQVLLVVGLPISVLFLVYAGFLYVKARGAPKELQKANRNFRYVLFGILLFLGAWTLGQILQSTLNALSSGSGNPAIGACN